MKWVGGSERQLEETWIASIGPTFCTMVQIYTRNALAPALPYLGLSQRTTRTQTKKGGDMHLLTHIHIYTQASCPHSLGVEPEHDGVLVRDLLEELVDPQRGHVLLRLVQVVGQLPVVLKLRVYVCVCVCE